MQQPPKTNPQNRQFLQPPSQQRQHQPDYTQPQLYPQQPLQQPNYTQPQTYYPPQQYQQPPQYQAPRQPQKKNSRGRLWLILIAVVFVLAVVMGLASRGQTQQPTTQATKQPTTQLTAQATTESTAKPTPQASIQSQLQSIMQKSGAAYVGGATVTYDASAKYAHVFESFPVTGDHNLDVSRIKQDAFAIQKAIWQAPVSGVSAVQVIFNSDDVTATLRLATCELEATTAAKLKWASITSDQAWSDYNNTWLSPSL